jgi:hypothetical protein
MVILAARVWRPKRMEACMTQSNALLDLTAALAVGLLLGSFVQYTVHRLMDDPRYPYRFPFPPPTTRPHPSL